MLRVMFSIATEIKLTPEKIKYFFTQFQDTQVKETNQENILGKMLGQRIDGYVRSFMMTSREGASHKFGVVAYETILGWKGRGGDSLPKSINDSIDNKLKSLRDEFSDSRLRATYDIIPGLYCSAGTFPIRINVQLTKDIN